MPKKRLLIISVSTGSGHTRAAEAIRKTTLLQYPNLTAEHIDMVEYIRLPMKVTVLRSYDLLTKQMPELWGLLYKKTDNPKVIARYQKLSSIMNRMNAAPFCEEVERRAPDYMLCTHFLPAQTILEAPKKYAFDQAPGIVMTDYDKHMFLIHPKMREYFVATEKMAYKLEQNGINPRHITVTGIPVDSVFYEQKSQSDLRRRYGIAERAPVILVLSGGQGLARTNEVTASLFSIQRPATIIAIAGANKKLERDLSRLSPPPHIQFMAIGWTDAIDEYMRISDVVITKPGGLTTTECVTLGKPMIAIQPIPGQEEHNAEYLLEHNFGRIAHDEDDLLYYVEGILDGRERMAAKETPAGEKTAAEKILDHIITATDRAA